MTSQRRPSRHRLHSSNSNTFINTFENLACRSIVLEGHYIDRHFIEDYGVLYSRSFASPENYCRRLHFFSLDISELRDRLETLLGEARTMGKEEFLNQCAQLSDHAYLGFCVIKPLAGAPVGRTVLRGNPKEDEVIESLYPSTRYYSVHLAGCEFRVKGLAFQQQDVGVSACATTALWSSLQQSRLFEEIKPATPAQITSMASQYLLPYGKPIPSEGLSVEQMCQAAQSLGVPPNLIRVSHSFEEARAHLRSAALSGFAPVVIMQRKDNPRSRHAVTAAGVQINKQYDPDSDFGGFIDRDLAIELTGIYIHDDRIGPYVPAKLFENANQPYLSFDSQAEAEQEWLVTHLLIPMHSKIRLSFVGLRRIATQVVMQCGIQLKNLLPSPLKPGDFPKIVFETRIERATKYIENLVFNSTIPIEQIKTFASQAPLSRYVGIIRLRSTAIGSFDLLVDTTSTIRNVNYLSLLTRDDKGRYARQIKDWLAQLCKCGQY